ELSGAGDLHGRGVPAHPDRPGSGSRIHDYAPCRAPVFDGGSDQLGRFRCARVAGEGQGRDFDIGRLVQPDAAELRKSDENARREIAPLSSRRLTGAWWPERPGDRVPRGSPRRAPGRVPVPFSHAAPAYLPGAARWVRGKPPAVVSAFRSHLDPTTRQVE